MILPYLFPDRATGSCLSGGETHPCLRCVGLLPRLLLILSILVLIAGPVWAEPSVAIMLAGGKAGTDLGPYLEQLEDPSGAMTLADIRSPQAQARFRPNAFRSIHIGHTCSAWWFRFKLRRSASLNTPSFLEFNKPGIGDIDLYIPQAAPTGGRTGTHWILKQTGFDRSLTSRDIPFRSFILRLPDSFVESEFFYLRIQSVMSINLQVTARSAENLMKHVGWDSLGFGLIYGVLIAMIIYNLCLLVFLKDRVYFYYILYMTGMLLHILFGYGHMAAWVDIPSPIQQTLFWIAVGNTWLWGIIFSRFFLETKRHTPRLDRFIRLFIPVAIAMMLTGLCQFWRVTNLINNVTSPIGTMLGILASVLCIRKGFRPAWYYLIAWIVLLLGVTLYAMGGILVERSFLTVYTLAIGSAIEAVLLSVALAARIRVLRKQKEALERRESRLTELSLRDGLTNLYNHRYLLAKLAGEIETAQRLDSALAILMLDVDHFKLYNDSYGHPEGDKVLVRLGEIMVQCARQSDTCCRYGGEEFTVILRGADGDDARAVAERIRYMIFSEVFYPRPGVSVNVSVSIGVACSRHGENEDAFIQRADEALYRAKQTGRNRVCMAA